ncbi:MAG TPA: hypothetical protein VFU36_02255, partial [Jatrophihabitans sp.]|nr:hypothetical protein [Jatrophihabitans sp.]
MTAPTGWNLAAGYPIALLPIRLEIRWLTDTLAVRVIPDTIHLDSFEPELTAAELAAGQFYWSQAGDAELTAAAWQQLADRFSAPRAAWIARATRTGNPAAGRAGSWTRTPQAVALPSRWTAVAQTGLETVRVTGLPLPAGPLPAGPDPQTGALPDWMLNFDAAVEVGMGLRLPLSPAMRNGVDRLLVYGVAESTDPATGAGRFADLLDRHYYTDGLRYLAPGTRTNNTDGQASGYAPGSPGFRADYQVTAADPAPATAVADSVAGRLSRLLGLPATADRAVNLASGATATEERTARAMNEALWAATWGYFLGQLLIADSGEEARRPDHSNVIADDAYLRSLDRQRLWPTAQRGVITGVLGTDPGEPGTAGFTDAWQQAITLYAKQHNLKDPAVAAGQLSAQVDAALVQLWHQRTGDYGTPADDWRVAAAALQHDRTARFAYFRWLDRTSRGGPAEDSRLADWLAGETASRYGDGTVLAARDHFADHVRPGGHLPTVGIGRQPYGILLTTALDRWQPDAHEAAFRPVVAALRALRDTVWWPAAQALPRLGAEQFDVDTANRALLDIMGTAPVSPEVFARVQLGPDYLRNLWRFAQPGLRPDWESVTGESSRQLLHDVGIAWRPRAAGLVGAEFPSLLTGPRVSADGTPAAGWLAQLADRATTVATLLGQPDLPGTGTPLLYRLLRHSLLREYADAAVRLLAGRHQLADWQHLDPELIGIRPGGVDQTVWSAVQSTKIGTVPLSSYLQTGQAGAAGAGIDRFRSAVRTLAEADDELLDRHLRQTLDATSHRLDAWISSIAARRLAAQRASRPTGVLLGGYGWLTDLRPAGAAPADIGFVHAPSLPQAVTAAVLRSGYDSHAGGAANPFAINLGSARVRAADELLAAVRAGLSPGAALGYLFERTLQQTVAGSYLAEFRAIAPSPARTVTEDGTLTATALPAGLVDGLVLAEKLTAGATDLRALLDRIQAEDANRPATPLRPAVDAALAGLHEIMDATADALLADAVHHAVNGAPSRAAATLDALADGEGSVPELDALRTPRGGIALSHRVALLLPADLPAVPGWPAMTPRAAASPQLELLLQRLLPDPSRVLVPASVQPAGADPVPVTVSLAEAGLS